MLQKTKVGKAMRAVADNRDLASSSGINVDRVILFVWMLGGALATSGRCPVRTQRPGLLGHGLPAAAADVRRRRRWVAWGRRTAPWWAA
ncbi:MAG: hypothetical protein WKF47_10530 [Geodermatophilaceae bacterium]